MDILVDCVTNKCFEIVNEGFVVSIEEDSETGSRAGPVVLVIPALARPCIVQDLSNRQVCWTDSTRPHTFSLLLWRRSHMQSADGTSQTPFRVCLSEASAHITRMLLRCNHADLSLLSKHHFRIISHTQQTKHLAPRISNAVESFLFSLTWRQFQTLRNGATA